MKEFYRVLIEDLEDWGAEEERFFTTLEAAESCVKQLSDEARRDGAVSGEDVPEDDRIKTADEYGDKTQVNSFVSAAVLYKPRKEPVGCMTGDLVDSDGNIIKKGKSWVSQFFALSFQIFRLKFDEHPVAPSS